MRIELYSYSKPVDVAQHGFEHNGTSICFGQMYLSSVDPGGGIHGRSHVFRVYFGAVLS